MLCGLLKEVSMARNYERMGIRDLRELARSSHPEHDPEAARAEIAELVPLGRRFTTGEGIADMHDRHEQFSGNPFRPFKSGVDR